MANYFKDRVVEHPGRVTLTPTGGTNEYDVDRAEGTVSEAGSPINAATLNTAIDTYGLWYGTSSTSANTAEKVVTCAGFTLTTGAKIAVHFTTANRVQGIIYLNVNGTGAIRVLVNDQYSNVGGSCTWDPGHVVMFSYDGANWRIINGAIINDDELDTIETALNLSHDGPARLYKIIAQLLQADRRTLLWTNPSPNANFGAQTVSLDLSNYDYAEIEFVSGGTAPAGHATPFRSGIGSSALCVQNSMVAASMRWRWFMPTATGVQFTVGYVNQTENNAVCRPYRIYGIKAGNSL